MKQVFGIFAALVLMPGMQVQAWVGGPWSNNSYQTNGDDGIYEAVGSLTDGTAMYRWAVNNNGTGANAAITTGAANGGSTSNVQFAGLFGAMNPHVVWYRGIVYYGRCFGMVNSGLHGGLVMVTGNATDDALSGGQNFNGVTLTAPTAGTGVTIKNIANSTFRASITRHSYNKRFHGYGQIHFIGEGSPDEGPTNFLQHGHKVGMKIFGSQVSTQVIQ